jgi:hypothetical protein
VSCTITNVKTLACDFQALFTPSLSVTILKNHTAVLDSTVTLLATISKTVANQSTLDTIVTLSLQGDRSRALDSTLSTSFTQSTQINTIKSFLSDLNSTFSITADGDVVAAAIEASATLTAEFTQSIQTSKTAATTVSLNTEFTVSVTAERFRGIEKTFIGEVTIFTEIGLLQNATCDFAALFTPTVTCVALKNHTAVLDAVSSLNCAITKTTNFAATLNTEFGLDIIVNVFRTITITVNPAFTHTIDAVKTVSGVSTINSTSTVTILEQKIKNAQASISSQTSLTVTFITFVSKWFNHSYRPLNLLEPAGAPGRRIFSTSIKKFGSHSLGGDNSKIRLNAGQGNDIDGNFTANDLPAIFGINDDIYKDLWMRVDDGENFTRRIWDFSFGPALGIYNRKLYLTHSYFLNNQWNQPGWGSGTQPGNIMTTQLSTGTFHHVAYIYTASQKRHSLYVNGTRVITSLPGSSGNAPNWYDTSQIDTVIPVYFDNNATFAQYYDDMKWFRNYTFGYTANDTTIAVPSTEYIPLDNVYTNLGALYRFNDNYLDTLDVLLSANANFSVVTTVTVTADKSVSASATLNNESTVSVIIGEIQPAAATLNSTFIITNKNPAVSLNFFVGTLETAQSSISSQFGLAITFITFVSKWYGTPRPITWISNANASFASPKNGAASLRLTWTGSSNANKSEGLAYADSYVNGSATGYFDIGANQDFTFEFWMFFNRVDIMDGGANPTTLIVATSNTVATANYQQYGENTLTNDKFPFALIYNNQSFGNPISFAFYSNSTRWQASPLYPNIPTPAGSEWFHMAVGRQNGIIKYQYNGNNIALDVGQTAFTGAISNIRSILLIQGQPYSAGVSGTQFVYYDDVSYKIGEWNPTGYTASPEIQSNEYTKIIGNFNGSLSDNLTSTLSAIVTLTAPCTFSITANKSSTAQATLNSAFTVSAQIGEIEPADISMNTVSTLSTVATRIKTFTVSMNAETTQSVNVSKITGYTATISSALTLSNIITRIKQFTTEFTVIATELATVVKIGQGLLTLDVVAQLTTVANRTAAAESNLLTQFGITAQGDRTRFGTVSTQSEFSLNAVNSRIRALNSSLDAEFAVTASNSRIRGTQSTQNSEFSIICEPLPIKRAISNQSAQFVQTTIEDRIRDTSVTFNTNFTQQSTGIIAVDAVADLNSEAQCTITVLRIRPGLVQMDAIAVNLTAAAKTGTGLVTIEIQSQCTMTAQKTTDIQLNAASTAQFASIIERIQQGVASITSTFTQIANGVLSTDVVANMNTVFSTTVTAQKTVRVIANISSAGGFVMAVAAIRNGEIIIITQTNITTSADRIRGTGANLTNSFTLNILAGKQAIGNSVQNTQFGITAAVSKLRLDDIVLYIKTESRTHRINNEQRSYALRQENRLYTIEE